MDRTGGNPYIDEVSELEADEDIAAGRVKTFENVDELMDDLKDEKNPGEYADAEIIASAIKEQGNGKTKDD